MPNWTMLNWVILVLNWVILALNWVMLLTLLMLSTLN
jgi:hypothetical protein